MPPMMMIPTKIAKTIPMMAPAAVLSQLKSSLMTMVAWLDCAAFPPPKDPPIQKIAKIMAAILPSV